MTDLAFLHDPTPRGRLLSNGRYRVLLTGAGSGCSTWGDVQLTGWDGSRLEDDAGWFIYLRDRERGTVWSVGAQPCGLDGVEAYAAHGDEGGVVITRRQHGVEARLAVCVLPDADAELRRLTLRNVGDRLVGLSVTAAADIVLNNASAHAAHPAFSKLFVQTEALPTGAGLLARRRPRSAGERPPLLGLACHGGSGAWQLESDRARFLGRNRGAANPAAVVTDGALSGTLGSVLDPVAAVRQDVTLAPGAQTTLDFVLAAAGDRDALLAALDAVASADVRDAAWNAAATAERARRSALGLDAATAEQLQDLAVALLYQHPALAAPEATRRRAAGGMAQIWALALGGRPLLVAQDAAAGPHLPEMLRAQAYWRALGLGVYVLVVASDAAAAEAAERVVAGTAGVVIRARDTLAAGDLDVALAWASLVAGGALPELAWGAPAPQCVARREVIGDPAPPRPALQCDNGVGGFSDDGTAYVIPLSKERRPPLAWINVVANEILGFLASENGAGYTWSRNSREHRLTPWANDPIADPFGEAFYLRDEDDPAAYWSPLPGPAPARDAAFEVRHGFGWTRWTHAANGLAHDVVQFVPRDDGVKLTRLRLTNTGGAARRLSLFAYARLVLGVTARDSARLIVTDRDAASGALLAHNRLADEFGGGEAFAALHAPADATYSATTDRAAFIGRNGSAASPLALRAPQPTLAYAAGCVGEPCFALQATFTLAPGATAECVVLLGEVDERSAVAEVVARYRDPAAVEAALAAVEAHWREVTGAVQVHTPEPAIDLMVNGWLLYQVLSCRIWGRSALYQSGGAYGFRDQLQDAAALVYARPDLTRAQLLLHAAHQFVAGDVLHWWHPPLARGIRTRFSDDLLWLPFLTAAYISVTGDHAILHETAGYVQGRLLAPGEDEAYFRATPAAERTDLYEHCCRAIDRSLATGAHGLPLMGTGDWNDGMNRVGREGRGESVWVGFFLYDLLGPFIAYAGSRGDTARATRYAAHREALRQALEQAGWDGAWYRRAYYDDGTPLGSASGDECRIDAIAQAWSVISGAGSPERTAQAMDAVETHLVDRDAGLIRLLAPPFDEGAHDPGYIKGYVPGIRENGGQYTHGALWVVQALAMLGRREHAAAYLAMLSPVSHAASAERLAVYQVEPYVVAADIYGVEPHVGRGGWTWYTGSAGWMYRIAIEHVLGVRIEAGDTLVVDPRIPDTWPGFSVALTLHGGATRCTIEVENPTGHAAAVRAMTLDGIPARVEAGVGRVLLPRDGAEHHVHVTLG